MRIAYVSLHWPRTIHSGVGKKITAQLNAWQAAGHDVRLFMHTHTIDQPSDLLPCVFETYQQHSGLIGKIRSEINRSHALSRLIHQAAAWKPDCIYMRFNVYAFPLQRLFRAAPVILEVVTNDVCQHATLGKGYSLYNRLTRSIALKRCTGLVCISQELAASPEFTRYNKPTIVVGDGIDLSLYHALPAPQNSQPHLVFIGSPGNAWHGVEKLFPLAQHSPDMIIDVIGYDQIPGVDDMPANIHLHGYLSGEEYRLILAQADAAVSSLSLHTISMEESSPLKTRECAALGIPLILPYRDTDLDPIEHPCILRIPNRPDNLITHARIIEQFVKAVKGKRLDGAAVRTAIDSREKEQRRLQFIQQILGMTLSS
jgi:hypothetical protein